MAKMGTDDRIQLLGVELVDSALPITLVPRCAATRLATGLGLACLQWLNFTVIICVAFGASRDLVPRYRSAWRGCMNYLHMAATVLAITYRCNSEALRLG